MRYSKKNLLFISIFDGLGFCTRILYDMVRILHDALVIAKGIKMCCFILDNLTIFDHVSLASQISHDKNKLLWLYVL